MKNLRIKHDQELMRRENAKLVFSIIKKSGSISRAQISRTVKMSPTSVGRIVDGLMEANLVKEVGSVGYGVGRKANLLQVDSKSLLSIGVEIDKGYIGVAVTNFNGEIIDIIENSDNILPFTPENVSCKIGEMANQLIAKIKPEDSKIVGVGVAVPGLIDTDNGKVIFSAQLKWENKNLADMIKKEIGGLPVKIDNEMKSKAIAESLYGAAQTSNKVVLMSICSGVGSALIINGEVYRGSSNTAGEIGHITVDPNGLLCECGRLGCLQTYIADWALLDQARKYSNVCSVNDIFKACEKGEQWACKIITRAVDYIGIAIGSLVCLYNPDKIILCGRVLEYNPEWIPLIQQRYYSFVWGQLNDTFTLEFTKMWGSAAIIGAGTMAFLAALDDYII
ncbi:MAG TPA: hypothetical protein DIW17_05745 [Clostridiales bacterium]|nr:ROK family protein [Clostridia bacterium]HCS73361.1 hypothetical protein [Clostridiales bacterium]